jgi:hypothetical protein
MSHNRHADDYPTDELEPTITDEAWPEGPVDEIPSSNISSHASMRRKHSALRCIEERREREWLRRELDDFDSGDLPELD